MLNKYDHQLFFWHLEISSKCALKCPRCTRTQQQGKFKVTQMSLDFVKNLMTPELLNDEVVRILLCGGEGDPIYNTEFHEIIKYLKETKPDLEIILVTNGSHKKEEWWKKTAEILNEYDKVVFSLDGWDNISNNLYRVGSNYDSALIGLQTMRKYSKACIQWATILFRFNQDKIDDIKQIAIDNGADSFSLTLSSIFGSNFPNMIDEELGYDPLEPEAEYISQYKGRHEKLYERLSDREFPKKVFDTISKRAYDKVLEEHNDDYILPLCKFGDRGLYVTAEGVLYPCSWVSHPFGVRSSSIRDKSVTWQDHFWNVYKDDFDLNKHNLETILNTPTWEILGNTWKSKEKAFVECERKCLRKISDWETLQKKDLNARFKGTK